MKLKGATLGQHPFVKILRFFSISGNPQGNNLLTAYITQFVCFENVFQIYSVLNISLPALDG